MLAIDFAAKGFPRSLRKPRAASSLETPRNDICPLLGLRRRSLRARATTSGLVSLRGFLPSHRRLKRRVMLKIARPQAVAVVAKPANEFNQDCRSTFDSSARQLMFRQSWGSNRPPLFSRSRISRRKKERSSVETDPSQEPGRSWKADLNFSLAFS
jgi:hypothetical protein